MKRFLAPSLLSANFYNLERDLCVLKDTDIKYLHLDVMDGIFVPNISFGIPVIKKIKENTKERFLLDTHLMITEPARYIEAFRDAGADILTIHVEATKDINDTIEKIKKSGMKAGVSVNPETDIHMIDKVLCDVDLVLVMSVHPGFGGQKFLSGALDKARYIREQREKNNYRYMIEMDGGINIDNIKEVSDTGVEIIVAGSAIFNGDIEKNVEALERRLCE